MKMDGIKNFIIRDWNDWFKMCHSAVPDIQNMNELYGQLAEVCKKHSIDGSVYPTEEREFKNNIFSNILIFSLVGGISLAILGFLIPIGEGTLTDILFKIPKGIVNGIFPFFSSESIICTCISAIISVILYFLEVAIISVPAAIFYTKNKVHKSVSEYAAIADKINEIKKRLSMAMEFVPHEYRNPYCLNFMYILYEKQRANNLSQASFYCDEEIKKNNVNIGCRDFFPDIEYKVELLNAVTTGNTGFLEEYEMSENSENKKDEYILYLKQRIKKNPYLNDKGDKGINGVLTEGELLSFTHPGSENPDRDLNNLIGLTKVKEQVLRLNARAKFETENGQKRDNTTNGNHMLFTGNPGTGKTTIARIIAGYLYQMGYIKENICVEVEGGTLKGLYVGHTSEKTKTIIEYAKGGVLFIDEAYNLMDNGTNGFGLEAIATLIKYMEDYRNDIIIILAGYKNEMKTLLDTNPGFTSRIKTKIDFENYNIDELIEILFFMKGSFNFSEEALACIRQQLAIEIRCPEFSNARDIRNWFDKMVDNHTYNWEYKIPTEDKTDERRYLITIEDVIPWRNERIDYLLDKGYIKRKTI